MFFVFFSVSLNRTHAPCVRITLQNFIMSCDDARSLKALHIGSITNRCSGKGPSLLPSWGGASTGLESAALIGALLHDDAQNNFDCGYN